MNSVANGFIFCCFRKNKGNELSIPIFFLLERIYIIIFWSMLNYKESEKLMIFWVGLSLKLKYSWNVKEFISSFPCCLWYVIKHAIFFNALTWKLLFSNNKIRSKKMIVVENWSYKLLKQSLSCLNLDFFQKNKGRDNEIIKYSSFASYYYQKKFILYSLNSY